MHKLTKDFADASADTEKLCDLWEYNKYRAHLQLAIIKQDAARFIKLLEMYDE